MTHRDTAAPAPTVFSTSTVQADALAARAGLPEAFRYLEAGCPRAEWPRVNTAPTAQHWLEVHDWFRDQMQTLTAIGGVWREGRVDAGGYRGAMAPRLRQFLGNLHHHHTLESEHAFPLLAEAEPRMAQGFALLDRDHAVIEDALAELEAAGLALGRSGPGDVRALADGLADQVDRAAGLIGRHLWDEEEIVVPVINLRPEALRF